MVRIVPAVEDDISRIAEIEAEAFAPPWAAGALLSELYREDSFFAVAYMLAGEKVCQIRTLPVGFVILRGFTDDGELLQIAVDRDARRCGIADLLMTAALGYAREKNLKAVFLEVRMSNDAAVALYKKHGFKSVRFRKDYYSNPLEDALVMVRDLK